MDQAWITLTRKRADIVLTENELTYQTLFNQPHRTWPCFATFIGKDSKNLILQEMFNGVKKNKSTSCLGQAYLRPELKKAGNDYPLTAIDCDVYHDNSFEQSVPSTCMSISRKLQWHNRSKKIFTSKYVNNMLFGNVMAPFSFVTCYFCSDLGGIRSVAELLAEQVTQPSISHPVKGLLPRCLFICETNKSTFDENEIEQRIYFYIYRKMRLLNQHDDVDTNEKVLASRFLNIRVLGIQKSWKTSARTKTIRNRLRNIYEDALSTRQRYNALFSFKHFHGLVSPLLDCFCSDSLYKYSLISLSRPEGSSTKDFSIHLGEFLSILPSEIMLWHLATPLISSALLLDSYPPGSHAFSPAIMYHELYARDCTDAINTYTVQQCVRDKFIDSVQTIYENEYSQLKVSRSASEIHRNTLSKLNLYLKDIKSHKTCLCCLMRSPEKVLSCGHAICDTCVKIFGHKLNKVTFSLLSCVFCGEPQVSTEFKFTNDTAGLRILSLDGGGVKGVITLEYLLQLQNELINLGCALHEYFDYVCGTSAGGLIILGLFLMQWSPEECLEKFQELAKKTFTERKKGPALFSRLQELLLYYTNDCQGDSSAIEGAFSEKSKLKMFNPLHSDTKVAVTSATARENLPCLFTNYNGNKRPKNNDYALVRAQQPSHDIFVYEAASCTTAAPWFLKPKVLKNLGTFQDGALCFPNPLRIALLEANFLWPDKGEPDFALSIGTGITSGIFAPFSFGPQSPVKLGSFSRIIRSCKRMFEPEIVWNDLVNEIPLELRSRYHRLNLQLQGPEISIDDVSSMENLRVQVKDSISSNYELTNVKDSMLASMFYFELEDFPEYHNGVFDCTGYISCRMNLPRQGREYLYSELLKTSSFFLLSGRPVTCVEKFPKSLPPFRRKITFTAESLSEHVFISLRGLTSKPISISGLPKTLHDLIRLQKLHTPFGRVDHILPEKHLPKTPRKRDYYATF